MKVNGMRLATAIAALAVWAAPAAAGKGCTCRANGVDYEEGRIICIRGELARCEMYLNNTSWKMIGETCPQSRTRDQRPAYAFLPRLPPVSLPSC